MKMIFKCVSKQTKNYISSTFKCFDMSRLWLDNILADLHCMITIYDWFLNSKLSHWREFPECVVISTNPPNPHQTVSFASLFFISQYLLCSCPSFSPVLQYSEFTVFISFFLLIFLLMHPKSCSLRVRTCMHAKRKGKKESETRPGVTFWRTKVVISSFVTRRGAQQLCGNEYLQQSTAIVNLTQA